MHLDSAITNMELFTKKKLEGCVRTGETAHLCQIRGISLINLTETLRQNDTSLPNRGNNLINLTENTSVKMTLLYQKKPLAGGWC